MQLSAISLGMGFGIDVNSVVLRPAFDLNFMGGMPAGLTYTNSSTTRTYFGSDGLLKTAVANEPIFEYDPVTLALLGMRWEMEQRTNLLLQSTLPGGGAAPTGWTPPVGTGTSAPVASIYGNADGSVAYEQSGTAVRSFLNQATPSLSTSTTYTFSVLIEAVTGGLTAEQCIVVATLPAGATGSFVVCPANPAGTAAGVLTTGVLEYRVVVGGMVGVALACVGLGVNANATGTIKFSRPQFEAGASRSSFIPTAAASVIRQPDVLTATSISPWYRQDEGTVVFEGIHTATDAVERGHYVFNNGTNTNRILSTKTIANASYGYIAATTTQMAQAFVTISANSVIKTAMAYKVNDSNYAVNGTIGTTDTSVTIPTITALTFGRDRTTSGGFFMGYARRFQYYNRRLTNSQIQGLSSV